MTAAAPSSESGTTQARDDGDAQIAQEQQDHQHHEADGERERELDVRRPKRGSSAVRSDRMSTFTAGGITA